MKGLDMVKSSDVNGPMTKRPVNWRMFLMKDDHKSQLSQVLCNVWSDHDFASMLSHKKVLAVVEGHAHLLTPEGWQDNNIS